MIDLYYWTTPNGHKITIFLEEAGLPYKIFPINISQDEQFAPAYLKISPNNKIPAIIDSTPATGGKPIAVFESGAILLYLAEKSGGFLASELNARFKTLEWLFWQVGGLGPMLGQNHHFVQYAPEKVPYAIERFVKETARLYGVLDKRLDGREFITDEYSIADMACFPWVVGYQNQLQDINNFPNIKRWLTTLSQRSAIKRAYQIATEINPKAQLPELFARKAAINSKE
jgi:GSH-dependent disulfide-bond oxidoreductase